MSKEMQGVLPALLTPFDPAGELAAAPLEALLERLYRHGSDGVYVCGQTGEGLLMPPEQRERTTEIAVANSPKTAQVIVHVGAASTRDAIRLARHAERAGATAISSLPPAGPYSFSELTQYYRDLAASTSLPLLVYFFPDVAPAIRTLEDIFTLCEIPNVIGLKFTDFDLYRLGEIRQAGHVVFNGRDEVFCAGLLMGASGGIGTFYNLAPATVVAIARAAREGQWAEARRLQAQLNALIRFTLRFPALAAVKQMMTWSGIDCGACLGPRTPLTAEQTARLRQEMAAAGFHPESFAQGIVA